MTTILNYPSQQFQTNANAPKFCGNKDQDYQEGSASIDLSKTKEPKKSYKSTDTYKRIYRSAAGTRNIAASAATFSMFPIILGGMMGTLFYSTVNDAYTGESSPNAALISNDLPEKAEALEERMDDFSDLANNEGAQEHIAEQMISGFYNYLDSWDYTLHSNTAAPNTVNLSDYINPETSPLTDTQQAELQAMLIEMTAADNIDDLRTLTNTIIDEYVTPVALASESTKDDFDVAVYKSAANNLIDDVEKEQLLYEIPYGIAAGGLAVALLSLMTSPTVLLPKPE